MEEEYKKLYSGILKNYEDAKKKFTFKRNTDGTIVFSSKNDASIRNIYPKNIIYFDRNDGSISKNFIQNYDKNYGVNQTSLNEIYEMKKHIESSTGLKKLEYCVKLELIRQKFESENIENRIWYENDDADMNCNPKCRIKNKKFLPDNINLKTDTGMYWIHGLESNKIKAPINKSQSHIKNTLKSSNSSDPFQVDEDELKQICIDMKYRPIKEVLRHLEEKYELPLRYLDDYSIYIKNLMLDINSEDTLIDELTWDSVILPNGEVSEITDNGNLEDPYDRFEDLLKDYDDFESI